MLLLIKIIKVNGKDFNIKAMYVSAWQQQNLKKHYQVHLHFTEKNLKNQEKVFTLKLKQVNQKTQQIIKNYQ